MTESQAAGRAGQEATDYAARLLTEAVLDVIAETDQATAQRLQAELEVKARAILFAKAGDTTLH